MNKKLKIKNKYLISLCDWLNNLQLIGEYSRERVHFIESCIARINEIESKKKEITAKYVEKDKDGNWMKKQIGERFFWSIPDDRIDDFNNEFNAIGEEEFIMEIENGEVDLRKIRKLILETDYKFGPAENDSIAVKQYKARFTNDYVKWCESFELFGA